MDRYSPSQFNKVLARFIFFSRWLQAPLYFGLIIAQLIYVIHFFIELTHLVVQTPTLKEAEIMMKVLTLIDVVMIANLLIMVIVGGYETFVSRLRLEGHPDQPEWLSHVNAGVLKVKLATALIGISSIHLLKTFIGIGVPQVVNGIVLPPDYAPVFWQIMVHLTFVGSALLLAWTDRISTLTASEARAKHH
jgi:uncharacterized protein (TIGR00645 family)